MENGAFERVVNDHHAALHRFALSLAGNEDDAGDLTQETLLTWARKGHQLRDETKTKSWLFTTLHRLFLERARRRARFPHHELEGVESEIPPVVVDLPSNLDCGLLLGALGKMDGHFRGPVALFYLEELPYAEIGVILGIPLGTVKSRIARGLMQLRKILAVECAEAKALRGGGK